MQISVQLSQSPKFSWKHDPDMPLEMAGNIQAVVVGGMVYVGGGWADQESDSKYVVMAYDISSKQWILLAPYRAE